MKPIAEQGYLIVAQNTKDVDYVDCARTLVKTIRYWHPDAQICLLTNEDVEPDVLFDYVHKFPFPLNEQNPYANDWQVFQATPFRETIKLEADMIITSPIDHWWTPRSRCWVKTRQKSPQPHPTNRLGRCAGRAPSPSFWGLDWQVLLIS